MVWWWGESPFREGFLAFSNAMRGFWLAGFQSELGRGYFAMYLHIFSHVSAATINTQQQPNFIVHLVTVDLELDI